MIKSGIYSAPKGYKSWETRRTEEAAALAEQLRQEKEANFIAEAELMLLQPESDLYQRCLVNIGELAQKRRDGPLFKAAMIEELRKIWQEKGKL